MKTGARSGVILGPLVRVGEEFEGLGDVLETLFRGRIARIGIRVQFLGQLAIGLADLVSGRRLGNTKRLVGIVHTRHALPDPCW